MARGSGKKAVGTDRRNVDVDDDQQTDRRRNRRAPPKEEKMSTSLKMKYIAFLCLICAGAIPTLLPLIEALSGAFTGTGWTMLAIDDPVLNDIFFGGEPHLVICTNQSRPIPAVWTQAASLDEDVVMVGIDCGSPLPSGKTVYDRFNLNPERRTPYTQYLPDVLVVANGRVPHIMPLSLVNSQSSQKDSESYAAVAAARKFMDYAKKRFVLKHHTVTDSTTFHKHCLRHSKCALVLHRGALEQGDIETLENVMKSNRAARWVHIDTKRYEVSLEKRLPALADGEKGVGAVPRVVALRRVEGSQEAGTRLVAQAHRGDWGEQAVSTFATEAFGGDGKDLSTLSKKPLIRKRRKQKKQDEDDDDADDHDKAKKQKVKRSMRKKKLTLDDLTDEEKAERAERLAKKKEERAQRAVEREEKKRIREMERRERMDQEAEGAMPRATTDDEEEVLDLDEDDEMVDLDDDDEEEI